MQRLSLTPPPSFSNTFSPLDSSSLRSTNGSCDSPSKQLPTSPPQQDLGFPFDFPYSPTHSPPIARLPKGGIPRDIPLAGWYPKLSDTPKSGAKRRDLSTTMQKSVFEAEPREHVMRPPPRILHDNVRQEIPLAVLTHHLHDRIPMARNVRFFFRIMDSYPCSSTSSLSNQRLSELVT